jgi:antitoxin component of RelBE/YafQ-DinJ toxin-antitoxin module
MFYKQIILQRGIPFEMKLPLNRVPDLGQMTSAQLEAELEKGYADIAAGRTKPADAVFDSIRKITAYELCGHYHRTGRNGFEKYL